PSLCSFYSTHTATTEIFTLSLHDALPILTYSVLRSSPTPNSQLLGRPTGAFAPGCDSPVGMKATSFPFGSSTSTPGRLRLREVRDRKSTRLNSSHGSISYAVFCLKKKKKK